MIKVQQLGEIKPKNMPNFEQIEIGFEYYSRNIGHTELQSEKKIEAKLMEEVKKLGGWAPKWVSPGNDGVPDRLIFMPGPRFIGLVETKSTKQMPSGLQRWVHKKLRHMGYKVWVIDSIPGVKLFIEKEVL